MGPLWGPGGDRGVYKTTDGGETWDSQPTPFTVRTMFFVDADSGDFALRPDSPAFGLGFEV